MIQFVSGNQIKLLSYGYEFFPALEAAIDQAVDTVHIQTYIYAIDETGQSLAAKMKSAAQRGVTVNLLLDGFGCKKLNETSCAEFVKSLREAGVNVAVYRPKISPWSFKKDRLRRLHRKVATIDGKLAFVGGINIINDMDVPPNTPPRIDYAVRIVGPLVQEIMPSTEVLWNRTTSSRLQRLNANIKAKIGKMHAFRHTFAMGRKADEPAQDRQTGMDAAFVIRDNTRHRRDIERAYLTAFAAAKQEILIENAYFIPGRRFRQALLKAAQRGVTVKVLFQGRMEYFLMFATHAYYNVFLKHGIQIYEYRKGFMHSKVAVVDGEWATVGSSNIDPFSLLLSHEANVVIKDKGFAQELRSHIEHTIQHDAYHVTAQEWERTGLVKRVLSWFAYGVVRLLLGIIGQPKAREISELQDD